MDRRFERPERLRRRICGCPFPTGTRAGTYSLAIGALHRHGFHNGFHALHGFRVWLLPSPSMILGGAFQAGSSSIACSAGQPCPEAVQQVIDRYQLDALRMMEFAFLSAYLWALWQLFQRMVTRDVTVYAFHAITVRVMTAAILSLIFFQALSPASAQVGGFKNVLPDQVEAMQNFDFFILLAFAIGFFPDSALTWLGAQARKRVFHMGAPASYLDIEEVEGIDTFTRARLAEIGILDAPRLAASNPLTLALRTPYSLQQIIDWIGQAQLLLILRDKSFESLRQQGIRTSFQLYKLLDVKPLPDFLAELKIESCQLLLESDPAFVRANEVAEKMINVAWPAQWSLDFPQQPALGEVLDQGAHAEGPGRRLVAGGYAVDQGSQSGRLDPDKVPDLVGEAGAGFVAVLDRREHSA